MEFKSLLQHLRHLIYRSEKGGGSAEISEMDKNKKIKNKKPRRGKNLARD